jgi:orotate phosphoribosyltransferase
VVTRERLARRIRNRSYMTGHFVLRSGATSTEYFDKYMFEADPPLLWDIADAMKPLVPDDIDALAGLELGGVPLAVVLSQVTGLPTRFVRREAKSYGTARLAEGGEIDGLRLLIVEDVITTGGQVRASAAELRSRGAIVDQVVCVIDREAGGAQKLAEDDLKLSALFGASEL